MYIDVWDFICCMIFFLVFVIVGALATIHFHCMEWSSLNILLKFFFCVVHTVTLFLSDTRVSDDRKVTLWVRSSFCHPFTNYCIFTIVTFSSQGYFSTPLSPLSKSAVQSAITTTFQGESPGYIEMAGITGSKDLEQTEEVIFEIISAVTQQKRTDR